MPLDVVLNELVVLQDGDLRLLRCCGNDQFFLHRNSCARSGRCTATRRYTSPQGRNRVLSWETPVPGGAENSLNSETGKTCKPLTRLIANVHVRWLLKMSNCA